MRIVLVDPSRTTLTYIARLLEARAHEVRSFTDGRAALDCIRSDPAVGVVITSLELITMSGVELCWEARLLASRNRPIYVILMSSSQDRSRLIEALDSGADDFISKPPVTEELYARLRVAERLATLQRELVRMATTDPLTGALNRRAFFETASRVLARAADGLAAIMFDIDHFKRVNDTYGHDAGDAAIRAVSRAAEREGPTLGRLGGEEFALLLDGEQAAGAPAAAERLRGRIAGLRLDADAGPLRLTCSFGVSQWHTGDTIDRLLKRADVALYAAKTGGRDRVVVADAALEAMQGSGASGVIRAGAA